MVAKVCRRRITIRKPDKTRRSFSLVLDTLYFDGSRKQTKLDSPELKSINARLKNNEISLDVAYQLVINEKERQLKEFGFEETNTPIINSDNKKIIGRYLKKVRDQRDIEQETYYNIKIDTLRILKMLGGQSLNTISRLELNKLVEELNYAESTKIKLVSVLNGLLKICKRDILIRIKRGIQPDISFITEDELKEMLNTALVYDHPLKDTIYCALKILFYTGLRTGELFAIKPNHIINNNLIVKEQVTRSGKIKAPKAGKIRSVLIPDACKNEVYKWSQIDIEDRMVLRESLTKIVKNIAKLTFPNNKEKHVSNHDLRHSYAIYALQKGLSLTEVAFLLGNTLTVCQKHYVGFTLQDESLNRVGKLLNG